jgi:hypothetical protein
MADSLSLDSWLVQSERSMHFRCPPGLNVTQDEYLNTLRDTAKELELPLQLETLGVTWTDANLQQQRIRAKLTSPEPFGLLTGLEYVGRVAFVEQKTYLVPPVLPETKAPDNTLALAVGGGSLLLGLVLVASRNACLGFLVIVIGVAIAAQLLRQGPAAAKKAREDAMNKWVKDVTDLARRAEVSNELNRMAQALDEAVKLAVDKLFKQRGAEMEADERHKRTSGEIQQELERRKAEGFK